jgi:type II secretory pathway pseudopilin PulG
MKISRIIHSPKRAYTLIEALVASSVLLIGISAAASLSLSMVTQEEMNERSIKAANYLDNAVRLYQSGIDKGDIAGLLPVEPIIESLTYSNRDLVVPGVSKINSLTLTMVYQANTATIANPTSQIRWTGGEKVARRTEIVEVIRADNFLTNRLARGDYVFSNP